MIILYTFLIGMSAFTLLVVVEWMRIQFRSIDEAFSRPLATFHRQHCLYMEGVATLRSRRQEGN